MARIRNPSAAADTGAGYMAYWANTGAVTLYKYTGGNNTDVQIGQATGIALTVGHTLSLRCLGPRITVSTNGVTRLEVTDTSVVGGGYVGMGSVDDGAGRLLRWDGFGGGAIAPGAGQSMVNVAARALQRRRRR